MVIWAMHDQDTICAVSTPVGRGGIGIIRVSGRSSVSICGMLYRSRNGASLVAADSHTVHFGNIVEPGTGLVIDEVLVTVMRAPRTYTREDVVEINCHGGMVPLRKTMELLVKGGARQATPGEFTRRAFLNGRIDLVQAEAVMDIIHAQTEMSHRAANEQLQGGLSREIATLRERLLDVIAGVEAGVDFPDDDIETPSGLPLEYELQGLVGAVERLLAGGFAGRILREGLATAIGGRPNVGKSSLLNALLLRDRAIVTDVPGTTRDVLEEHLNVGGLLLRVLDTAGIRHSHDIVEREGVRRSLAVVRSADIVLIVLDGSQGMRAEDRRVLEAARGKAAIAVINKNDLPRRLEKIVWPEVQIDVSCRSGAGIERLRAALFEMVQRQAMPLGEHAWAVNQRHESALKQAKNGLERALEAVRSAQSPEFIALDLREALDQLGMIVGATHTEDILERIFRDFCIGK
jgi:tRNA modification GTPase